MVIFDATRLNSLVDGVDAITFAHGVLETYQQMLNQRVGRVVSAVCGADGEKALDAVLSLKVSSTMVGAMELSMIATSIEREVRAGDFEAALADVLRLPSAAERADCEIAVYLGEQASGPGSFATSA